MIPLGSYKSWLILSVGLAVGAAGGYFLAPQRTEEHVKDVMIRQVSGQFTRPLLECEVGTYVAGRREIRYFKEDLKKTIEALEDGKRVQKVAVYFRDLDNGPWLGVGEDEEFTPASLFKVPLIIACYRQAEILPGFLETAVTFAGLPDPELGSYHFPPAESLQAGRRYTLRDLIDRTARYSDNAAAWVLEQAVDKTILSGVYSDLGLDPAKSLYGSAIVLSPTTYGRFFRVLYNATYLNREYSEVVLQAFSRSVFKEGLVAGLPEGTVVAHKFGEKMKEDEGIPLVQLHDVGIVYHAQTPYLLCVMTLGTDYAAQASAIASVSRFVWDQVEGRSERPVNP